MITTSSIDSICRYLLRKLKEVVLLIHFRSLRILKHHSLILSSLIQELLNEIYIWVRACTMFLKENARYSYYRFSFYDIIQDIIQCSILLIVCIVIVQFHWCIRKSFSYRVIYSCINIRIEQSWERQSQCFFHLSLIDGKTFV